jgi:hypothetical protein
MVPPRVWGDSGRSRLTPRRNCRVGRLRSARWWAWPWLPGIGRRSWCCSSPRPVRPSRCGWSSRCSRWSRRWGVHCRPFGAVDDAITGRPGRGVDGQPAGRGLVGRAGRAFRPSHRLRRAAVVGGAGRPDSDGAGGSGGGAAAGTRSCRAAADRPRPARHGRSWDWRDHGAGRGRGGSRSPRVPPTMRPACWRRSRMRVGRGERDHLGLADRELQVLALVARGLTPAD